MSKGGFLARLKGDHQKVAELLEQKGELDKAADRWAKAGEFARAAAVAVKAGDRQRAVRYGFKAALGADAGVPAGAAGLQAGEVLEATGHRHEAVLLYELDGHFQKAAEVAARQKKYMWAARLYERGGEWGLAARFYERVGKIPEAVRNLGRESERLGQLVHERRDPGAAKRQREVDDRRAVLLAQMGRSEEAVEMVSGREATPKSAQLLEQGGRYEEAVEAYLKMGNTAAARRALGLVRGLPATRRADLFRRCGDHQEAGMILAGEGFHEAAADDFEAAGDVVSAAIAYERSGRMRKAAALYENAARPADAVRCWAATGEFTRARALARETGLASVPEPAAPPPTVPQPAAQQPGPPPSAPPQPAAVDQGAATELLAGRAQPEPSPELEAMLAAGVLPVGHLLAGRYEILSELGRGGMGRVYAAQDRELGEKVAVKTFTQASSGQIDGEARLRREVQLCRRITHSNIVRMHDLGRFRGGLFLTMELLAGHSLAHEVETHGPLALDRTRWILGEMLSGLAAAHDEGILHRDLKPENVFLSDRHLKILDFGVAWIRDANTRLTTPGKSIGTPLFMSPEQLMGEELDARSDLYSAGLLAYTLLTGAPPFGGGNLGQVAMQHLQTPPPDVAGRRAGLPESWRSLVHRLLAKKREERPPSAREVLNQVIALPTQPTPA